MKVLFVTNRLLLEKSGAQICSKRNYENLKKNVSKLDIYNMKGGFYFRQISSFIFNRLEGSTIFDEKKVIKLIEKNKYDIIFLDNSGFGYLSEKIRKTFPRIKIIVFCHDINFSFFKSILEDYKNDKERLKKIFKILKIKKLIKNSMINEKKSFKNADKIITLNKRDSRLLWDIYGYTANEMIGITIEKVKLKKSNVKNKIYNILFVGNAGLKSNLVGINFFINNVLPFINAKVDIVGKDMELYKEILEVNSRVKVIGSVEKLEEYYEKADAVIAPIFSGGGMKVKIAEALSFGKTIFGTNEAFEGYDLNFDKVGGICNSSVEFIEKINDKILDWEKNDRKRENIYSKEIFLKEYSYESSEKKFNRILKQIEEN